MTKPATVISTRLPAGGEVCFNFRDFLPVPARRSHSGGRSGGLSRNTGIRNDSLKKFATMEYSHAF